MIYFNIYKHSHTQMALYTNSECTLHMYGRASTRAFTIQAAANSYSLGVFGRYVSKKCSIAPY